VTAAGYWCCGTCGAFDMEGESGAELGDDGGSSAKTVIVVVGATGAGKSRLGIDLATALNGEVLNADALQVRPKP